MVNLTKLPKNFNPLLEEGQLIVSDKAMNVIAVEDIGKFLARHLGGDWGEVSRRQRAANDYALVHYGDRFLSAFRDKNGVRFCIRTSIAQRISCVLLPEEL